MLFRVRGSSDTRVGVAKINEKRVQQPRVVT